LQDLDRALRGEMPALLVRGPEFEGGNELTVAFQLGLGQHAGSATIRPMRRAWLGKRLKCTVHGGRRHAIQLGHSGDLRGAFGTFGRQAIQALPQLEEGISGNHLTARSHGWRAPDTPRPAQYLTDEQWPSRLCVPRCADDVSRRDQWTACGRDTRPGPWRQ